MTMTMMMIMTTMMTNIFLYRCLVSHLRGKKLKILCVDDNDDDDNNYDDNADNDDQHIFVQVPGIPFGITAQTIYLATGLIIAAYHVRK